MILVVKVLRASGVCEALAAGVYVLERKPG